MITTAIIFEAVKSVVPIKLAAERYGLHANHEGMAHCPFHAGDTPSLKLGEEYFYCPACGAGGNVINLTSRLFGLSPCDAARKLAADFGVEVPPAKPPDGSLNRFRSDLLRCQRILDDYLNLLLRWKNRYYLRDGDKEPDDRYVEVCQMLEPIDYMASVLAAGTLERRVRMVARLVDDGKMDQLEERLTRLIQEETASQNESKGGI